MGLTFPLDLKDLKSQAREKKLKSSNSNWLADVWAIKFIARRPECGQDGLQDDCLLTVQLQMVVENLGFV